MTCAPAYFSVKIASGEHAYELARDVDSFTVDHEASRPSELEVTLGDPFHVFSHAVREGLTVEVSLGEPADHGVVFRGLIDQVSGDFPQDAVPTLHFVAHDGRMRMGLRERSRPLASTTLSDVFREVAGVYFPRINTEFDSDQTFEGGIRQKRQTDLDFLLDLARQYECELILRDGPAGDELVLASSSRLRNRGARVKLHYQRSGVEHLISSFQPRRDLGSVRLSKAQAAIDETTGETTPVAIRQRDVPLEVRDDVYEENMARFAQARPLEARELALMAAVAEETSASFEQRLGKLSLDQSAPSRSSDQTSRWSEQRVAAGILGMQADATIAGVLEVRPTEVVRITNVGGRFSGDWYLNRVRHVFDGSGHRTELGCER
jgi:phage protein D